MKKYFRKLTNGFIAISLLLAVGVPTLTPVAVFAQTNPNVAEVCHGLELTGGKCGDETADTGVSGIIKTVINILSMAVGVIAVIMIIIGGLKYITSSGDSGSVNSAKNTILFAIVGLIIVALAQVLVRFVLNKVKA